MKTKIAVIGGGPAGLAAALSAYEAGVSDILILERDGELGGILNQCIHNGFGLHTFKEELTGPEYAVRYIDKVQAAGIPCELNTMVIDIRPGTPKVITAMNKKRGMFQVEADAVILAMGCRERPRGQLNIPGYRPAGIYAAGTAQRFVNIEGRLPGKEVVVLGSGDIGLIMARRMTLQGAKVKMVAEIMPYSGGLRRNIVQCLDDYHIPLKLCHTVTAIHGRERLQGVTVARVDEKGVPDTGTEEYISCDTLLISCGLIPENELSAEAGAELDMMTGGPVVNDRLETTVAGVFACGNVLHVHDLVDNVSREAGTAGRYAVEYLQQPDAAWGEAVRPKIPEKNRVTLPADRDSKNQMICIRCPVGCLVSVNQEADGSLTITGNSCPKGEEYARKEVTAPTRTITSLIRVADGTRDVVSVKTSAEVPKDTIFTCMEEIKKTIVTAPVFVGEILIKNIAGTGCDMIATTNIAAL